MSTDLPFVGRERELADLETVLHGIEADGGAFVLVTGEPGIGKSALCSRFAARAQRRGVRVSVGRTWEWGGAPPYWPWVQVLRQLNGSDALGAADPLAALQKGAGPETPSGERDERARFALFDKVAARLRDVANEAPLLVVLEDLHAADLASLLCLRFVVESLDAAPLLVVGTWRSVEAELSPQAASLMSELARTARTIELDGLPSSQIAELLPQPVRALEVQERTGGNPLFIAALVEAGIVANPGSLPPLRARSAVERRVARLDVRERDVLSAAAVLGREVAVLVLARVCGRPVDAVLAQVRVLLDEHILQERQGAPGRYGFRHGLFQEVVYAALSPAERLRLHRAAGHALEELYGAERHMHSAELSRHFLAVAPEPERGLEYAVQAAEAAMRSLAFEEAVAHFRRALTCCGSDVRDAAHIGSLWLRLAKAEAAAGEVESACRSLMRAREAALQVHEASLLARVAIARSRIAGFGRKDDEAVHWLEQALEQDVDMPCRVRLLGALADRLWPYPRCESRVADLGREALELSERVADPRLRAEALARTLFALWTEDAAQFAELRARVLELSAISERLKDPELRVEALRWSFTTSMIEGAVDEAKRTLDEYERLAVRLGRPQLRFNVLLRRFMLAMMEGCFADAERLLADAERAAERAGDPQAGLLLTSCRVALDQIFGDRETLERHLCDLDGVMSRDLPRASSYAIRALLETDIGARDRAERSLARYFEHASSCMAHGGPVAWGPATWAVWRLGDAAGAKRLMPWLRPCHDRMLMSGAIGFLGPGSLFIGLAAATAGRQDEAIACLEHAIEALDRVGARVLAAQARRAQALALAGANEKRAAQREQEALDAAASLGLPALAERHATAPGLPPPAEGRRSSHLPTTPPAPALGQPRVQAGETSHDPLVGRFIMEEGFVIVALGDRRAHVRRSKGLALIERLLRHEGRDVHVLELEGGALDDRGRGEPMLDARAKAAYRSRVRELREALEEAERCGDAARALQAREELEFVASELSRAVGMNDRDRSHGVAERARARVTLAIRRAIKSLERAHPVMAAHLGAAISTGTFCTYRPDPRARIDWCFELPVRS